MKRLLLLALAACGHPAVHLDVAVSEDLVLVTASDPAVRDSPLFVHPGSCGGFSDDDPGCLSNCPGDWIAGIRLESGGETVGTGDFRASRGAATIGAIDTTTLSDAVVVIEADDGDEVRVPLPAVTRPVPIIDTVDTTGDIAITWHTDPLATSTDLGVSNGFTGQFCHVGSGAGTKLFQSTPPIYVGVTAYAPPVASTTAFGDAEVWVGTSLAM